MTSSVGEVFFTKIPTAKNNKICEKTLLFCFYSTSCWVAFSGRAIFRMSDTHFVIPIFCKGRASFVAPKSLLHFWGSKIIMLFFVERTPFKHHIRESKSMRGFRYGEKCWNVRAFTFSPLVPWENLMLKLRTSNVKRFWCSCSLALREASCDRINFSSFVENC